MTYRNLSDISARLREIDICMLSTHAADGAIAGRPMSNNRQVDYDGDSYYFTWEHAGMIGEIERDRNVSLAFQGKDAFFVAVEGQAVLVRDKRIFREHWTPDLDHWFKEGIDTEGVVMIKVSAKRVHYWDGEDDGELSLNGNR